MTTEITAVSVDISTAWFVIDGLNLPIYPENSEIVGTEGKAAIEIKESSSSELVFDLVGTSGPPQEDYWELSNGLRLEHLGLAVTPSISFSGLTVQFEGNA